MQESSCPSGAAFALDGDSAAIATSSAASLLLLISERSEQRDYQAAEAVHLALAHLPWILSRGPRAALRLMTGADEGAGGGLGDRMPIDSVLPLLEGRGDSDDVRWEYLRGLVHGKVGII